MSDFKNTAQIFSLKRQDFLKTALEVFRFQAENNFFYRKYIQTISRNISDVKDLVSIPFLPISFFKTHQILCGTNYQVFFDSSGTTGQVPSRHYVKDPYLYEESLLGQFEQTFGSPADFCILALLPGYMERPHSSLVYMVQTLMNKSNHELQGFYLNEWSRLREVILSLEKTKQKYILLGVSFALLDFATTFTYQLENALVIETGGMKGRRKEMRRSDIHSFLREAWKTDAIYSEYGMTELLSQSYSLPDREGIFCSPNWKKVLVRDLYDPFHVSYKGRGALNIIDLANIYSCSFIATDDVGVVLDDETFQVEGRLSQAEIRGCNLLFKE